MLGTYSQLNSEALKLRVKKVNITQAELATRLGVNIKTVQRWVNGHITRVRTETVQQLSDILICPLDEISHAHNEIKVLVKNKVLEALLSEDIVQLLYSTKHWDSYLIALKEFEHSDLATVQQAQLFLHIGYIQYQLGCYRSAQRYMNKAIHGARVLQDPKMLIKALCFSSSNHVVLGDVKIAEQELQKAVQIEGENSSPLLRAEISYRQAKIFLVRNDFVIAGQLLRNSIALELRTRMYSRRGLSVKYIQLARLELRQGNLSRAERFYMRAGEYAQKSNLRVAEAVACYGRALLAAMKDQKDRVSVLLLRARKLVGGMSEIQKNQKLLQIEFMFAFYAKDYARCSEIINLRYKMNRRSKLLVVNTVKMALLLDRISDGAFPVRRVWIVRCQRYLSTLSNNINQAHFRVLLRGRISASSQFKDLVEFLVL